MKLRNSFTDTIRILFTDNHRCWRCGQNTWDSLHHIIGRDSNSPLNAAPLCNEKCHLYQGNLHIFEKEREYLERTYQFLRRNGYNLTPKDKTFMLKYKKHYDRILARRQRISAK